MVMGPPNLGKISVIVLVISGLLIILCEGFRLSFNKDGVGEVKKIDFKKVVKEIKDIPCVKCQITEKAKTKIDEKYIFEKVHKPTHDEPEIKPKQKPKPEKEKEIDVEPIKPDKPVEKVKVSKDDSTKIVKEKPKDEEKVKPSKEESKSSKEDSKSSKEDKKSSKENMKSSKEDHKKPKQHAQPKKPAVPRETMPDKLFDELYTHLPTFAPDYANIDSLDCRTHGQIFMRQLRGNRLWAMQMLDSSAKIPSGVLRGNLNQLGDFDECVQISTRVKVNPNKPGVPIRGKYCLAEFDITALDEELKLPVHLVQARSFIRSHKTDPGHFIPKFTTLKWGICIPDGCTHEDAEKVLYEVAAPYNITTGLKIVLSVDPDDCYVKKDIDWLNLSPETYATVGFYTFIVLITAIATLKDCWKSWTEPEAADQPAEERETPEDDVEEIKTPADHKSENWLTRIFMGFSLKRTGEALFKESSSDGDIECIHGVRAMGTIILYLAHKLLPMARVPFSNRIFLTEISNSPWSVIFRSSIIYTDTFLMLSGILTAYNIGNDLKTRGHIPWLKRHIARFFRLTPALLAVVLFYAYVWEHIGSGPQWNSIVSSNAELCKQNLWRNLLYIQNFYPFEEMCATHTHQLALDWQLTLLAPILVWFLYKRPIWGVGLIGGLHALSVGLRYYATINHKLSVIIFHGMSLSQLYRTANFSYTLTLHRATPYLAGIGLGVLLRQTGKKIRLPKVVVALGWMVALYFFGWTFNAPIHLARRDYQYDVTEAAQFAALSSVAWALGLSWLIFACYTDNGGPINTFLCSRPMIILSRISYSFYLIQFAVMFYNVGTTRSSSELKVTEAVDLVEMVTVFIAAIIVTLLFDSPMQTIKSVIMSSVPKSSSLEEEEEEANADISEQQDHQYEEQHEISELDHSEYDQSGLDHDADISEPYSGSEPISGAHDPDATHYDYDYDDDYIEEEEEDDEEVPPPANRPKSRKATDDDLQGWEWTVDED